MDSVKETIDEDPGDTVKDLSDRLFGSFKKGMVAFRKSSKKAAKLLKVRQSECPLIFLPRIVCTFIISLEGTY